MQKRAASLGVTAAFVLAVALLGLVLGRSTVSSNPDVATLSFFSYEGTATAGVGGSLLGWRRARR